MSSNKFNWDDHPVVEPAKFNWEDHPIAPDYVEKEPETPFAASAAAGAINNAPFATQIGAAGKTALDVLTGSTSPSDALDEYRNQRDLLKEDLNKKAAANPKTAFVAGLPAMAALPLGASNTLASAAGNMALYGGANALSNSKADLTKGEFAPAAADTAMGAGVGALAGTAGYGVSKLYEKFAPPVANYLKKIADKNYLKAGGATGADLNKIGASEVGNSASREEIIDALRKSTGFFSTPGDIAKNADALMDESGGRISDVLKDLAGRGVKVSRNDIIDALKQKAAELTEDESQADLARSIQSKLGDVESVAAKNPEVPIDVAEGIKRNYQSKVNWKSPDPDVVANNANTAFSDAYRQATEDAAIAADQGLASTFQAEKQAYGPLKTVRDIAQKRQNTLSQSPHGGLLDIAAAGSGGTIGASVGGVPGAVIGGAAGYAAKALRPRYASMVANSADLVSNLARNSPQLLGRWAPVFTEAAASQRANAIPAADYILQQTDPAYREHILGLKEREQNRSPSDQIEGQ